MARMKELEEAVLFLLGDMMDTGAPDAQKEARAVWNTLVEARERQDTVEQDILKELMRDPTVP